MASEAAAALRNFIGEKGLSQTEFGKKIGVSQSMVGQWLREERPISIKSALEMERVYKLDAAVLSRVVKTLRETRDKNKAA